MSISTIIQQFNNKTIKSLKNSRYYYVTVRLIIALLILFVLYRIYVFWHNQQILGSLNNVQTFSHDQALHQKPLVQVNQLFTLPTDTDVTVGNIADVKSLASNQSFFKKARSGDMLLIYPNMTVIYDPVNKYIVDVSEVKLLK